ncbi:hypothetical protein [Nocardioides stalactiti]|uniref:hypothetical protein n=1 Tax=Nocardioides stalactiti TaxID=2755356 RepID=UPI001602704F|nr:hypothetical protein [Nocardioides stalactiti]
MSTSGPDDNTPASDDEDRPTVVPPVPGAIEGLGALPGAAPGAAPQVGAAASGVGTGGVGGAGVGSAASVGAGTGSAGSAAGLGGAGSSMGTATGTGGAAQGATFLGLPVWVAGGLGAVVIAAAGTGAVVAVAAGGDDEPSSSGSSQVSDDGDGTGEDPGQPGGPTGDPGETGETGGGDRADEIAATAPEGRWTLQIEATRSTADNFYSIPYDNTLRLAADCGGTACTGTVGKWPYTWDGTTLTFTIPPEIIEGPCADEDGNEDPDSHGRVETTWTPAVLTLSSTDAAGSPTAFTGTGQAYSRVTELRGGCTNGFKGHGDATPEADLAYTLTRKGS